MKLLDSIITLIQTNSLGVPGKTLFRDYMPSDIKSGTLVLARVAIEIDPYTGLRKGSVQIVSRDKTPDLARKRASDIMKVVKLEDAVVAGVSFKFIRPKHEPIVFPRADGGLFEASVNYQFVAQDWEQ